MQKTVRFIVATLVCLCPAFAWAQSSLRISPTQFYVFDVENFLRLSGATLGTASTVVTYTNGNTVLTVNPQVDPDNPSLSDVWVPFEVSMTAGQWDVRVIATDIDGMQTISGPAALEIVERPEAPAPPPPLPEVLVVEATSSSGGDIAFDAGGAECNYASGAALPIGTTTVTCTRDGIAESFTVVVTDSEPPVLTLPPDITSTSHTVTFIASAIDNIDGAVAVECEPASGSSFPEGQTIVQCSATDAHANYASGSFTVTVSTVPPPLLHLPDDITTEATGPAGATVTFTATADNATIQCSPASPSLFPLGTTTVNCSATNAAGTAAGSFKVSVVDTTPPAVTSTTPSESAMWPPNHAMHAITIGVVATDLVDPSPASRIVSVSSNQPVNGTGDGDTAPDWVITGDLTLQLRAERAARLGARVYTITVATTDASGNTRLSTCTVTVQSDNGRR